MRLKAYGKDIRRTIRHSGKRFIAIMAITFLGVTMFSGLSAACGDLRDSADAFFDAQKLHDLSVTSAMGLTDDDIEAVSNVSNVESAVGIYGAEVTARGTGKTSEDSAEAGAGSASEDSAEAGAGSTSDDSAGRTELSAILKTIPEDGTDSLYLIEGRLPEKADEAAVTEKFLDESGLAVGDTLYVTETAEDDEDDTAAEDGEEDTAAEDGEDDTAAEDDEDDTAAEDGEDDTAVDNDGSSEESDVENGAESDEGDGAESAEENSGENSDEGAGNSDVFRRHEFTVTAAVTDPSSVNNPTGSVSYRDAGTSTYSIFVPESAADTDGEAVYMSALIRVSGADSLLCYSDRYEELIDSVKSDIKENIAGEREDARLSEVQAEALDDLEDEREDAQEKIDDARKELNEVSFGAAIYGIAAPSEVTEEVTRLDEEQEKLDSRIADAKQDIEELEKPVWYIHDRSAMAGYQNIGSDADSIESIAAVFPVVFFVVAVLMSLTAVTRMVEEERGLIGTYKALGYTDREIQRKYLIYSGAAGAAGSAAGTFAAFVILPAFIFTIFRTMYLLPDYGYHFDWKMGIAGPLLFTGGILLTALVSCRSELLAVPAALMRPRAPKRGIRIILERISPLWKRFSFLNKVTARNLFRYKKRLFMTIAGIAGCMALLLFGFGIRDSVHDLSGLQYDSIFHYDMMAVGNADDDYRIISAAADDENIDSYISMEAMSGDITYRDDSDHISATVIVFPDDLSESEISEYISFAQTGNKGHDAGRSASVNNILVTVNAGNVLGFGSGDKVNISLSDLKEAEVKVTALTENYLGNYVYMRESTFENLFEEYEPNGILAVYSEDVTDPDSVTDAFSENEGVLSCVGTNELKASFDSVFRMINAVVYIIILMSAALAFVVLFTLQTTNISERERELATIKVLGFYDREVHLYVNKESFILTVLGIIPGLPLGYAFAQTLVTILNLPAIYFKVSLHPVSYVYAVTLTLVFAFTVDLITDRTLNRIDPAAALKSVE